MIMIIRIKETVHRFFCFIEVPEGSFAEKTVLFLDKMIPFPFQNKL